MGYGSGPKLQADEVFIFRSGRMKFSAINFYSVRKDLTGFIVAAFND